MTNNSLTLSKDLDQITIALFSSITAALNQCGVQFVVIGATARDVILHYIYKIPIRRLTKDVDLAIIIKNWEKFDELKNALLAFESFSETPIQHRLMFHGVVPLDLVPFGEIAKKNTLLWPPDGADQLNITGYQETFDNAITIMMSKKTEPVRFASLPNLTTLKFFAWQERGSADPKDAIDIWTILDNYVAAGNRERLYDQHIDAMESVDFDEDLAGALVLGRDIKTNVYDHTRLQLLKILEPEIDSQADLRLASHILSGIGHGGGEMEVILTKLRLLKQGLE